MCMVGQVAHPSWALKTPHVLGNVMFWRGVSLFKGEEGWKRAEVCRYGTYSFAAGAAKRLENRSTEQIVLFWSQEKYQILIHTEKEKNLHCLARESTAKPIHEVIVELQRKQNPHGTSLNIWRAEHSPAELSCRIWKLNFNITYPSSVDFSLLIFP